MTQKSWSTLRLQLIGGFVALALCGCQAPSSQAGAKERPAAAKPVPKEFRGKFVLQSVGLPQEGMWKCKPLLADLNNDGYVDLVASSRKEPGLRVWLGSAAGAWTESSKGLKALQTCGGGIDTGDLNQDGHMDLAVADHCSGAHLFLGDGKGGWPTESTGPVLETPEGKVQAVAGEYGGTDDLELVDFDKDGALDLVLAGAVKAGIRAFRGSQGGASWTESSKGLPTHGFCSRVLVEDINKDGKLDVVASHEKGPFVCLGDGHGNWEDKSTGLPRPHVGGLYFDIAIGDINEDGLLDLAAANRIDGVEVFWQNPNGSWDKRPDVFPEMKGGATGIGLNDITGDGHLDIVATGRKPFETGTVYGVFALFGNGKGEFTPHLGELPDTGLYASWSLAFGDVNKDGVQDFVASIGGHVASGSAALSPIQTRMQVWRWEPAR